MDNQRHIHCSCACLKRETNRFEWDTVCFAQRWTKWWHNTSFIQCIPHMSDLGWSSLQFMSPYRPTTNAEFKSSPHLAPPLNVKLAKCILETSLGCKMSFVTSHVTNDPKLYYRGTRKQSQYNPFVRLNNTWSSQLRIFVSNKYKKRVQMSYGRFLIETSHAIY